MSKNKHTVLMCLALLVICSPACERLIEVDSPRTQLTPDKVFADDNSATSAVTGIYAFLNQYNNNYLPYLNMLTEMSADNGDHASGGFDMFRNNALSSGDTYVSSYFWATPYQAIYQCNAALEQLESATSLSANNIRQLQGELLFLRAYLHFNLVNIFGDVPLILSTRVAENTSASRTREEQVYDQIIADLKKAIPLLQPAYVAAEKTRANTFAAQALLARVYLYRGNWAEAERLASAVIDAKAYQLETDLAAVFQKNSKEAILQLWTQNGYTQTGAFSIPNPASSSAGYYLTDDLVGSFEAADQRKAAWVRTVTYSGKQYAYAFKYRQRVQAGNAQEYTMLLRLAELYLIRCEALLHLERTAEAITDLNTIRGRAGLLLLDKATTVEAVKLAIERERRAELFWECSHRWFDLKRTGRALAVLTLIKPAIKAEALLYPIPQAQRAINPNLAQNPGY